MRRILIPLIFGLAGASVLISLGVWQVQRLSWKEGVLAKIETQIAADPVSIPDNLDPQAHRYLPVVIQGQLGQNMLRVLVSQKRIGAGYRLITRLSGARNAILIDLGFIRVDQPLPTLPSEPVTITGNLLWPDDRNSSTPENDTEDNIWFARDLTQMAKLLDTAPVLVVARDLSFSVPGVTPLPVDTSHIPNDHLNYVITWFSLAAIWLAMTGYFLWRSASTSKGDVT